MAIVTVLGPGGYSRPPYASFAGKPPSGASGKLFRTATLSLGAGGPFFVDMLGVLFLVAMVAL